MTSFDDVISQKNEGGKNLQMLEGIFKFKYRVSEKTRLIYLTNLFYYM